MFFSHSFISGVTSRYPIKLDWDQKAPSPIEILKKLFQAGNRNFIIYIPDGSNIEKVHAILRDANVGFHSTSDLVIKPQSANDGYETCSKTNGKIIVNFVNIEELIAPEDIEPSKSVIDRLAPSRHTGRSLPETNGPPPANSFTNPQGLSPSEAAR